MAKIIIDIDDNLYTRLFDNGIDNYDDAVDMAKAIRKGIPFPKGHRKLIAEPTEEDIAKTVGGKNDFADCIRETVKTVFANAPTIIEADTAESEEI